MSKIKHAFRILTFILIAFFIKSFLPSQIQAQNVISSGTTVQISPGTFVTTTQNMVVENGASLTNKGSVILKNNFTNHNTVGDFGSGTFEFSGTSPQSLSGQNTFGSLELNNPTGLDVNGNTKLNTGLGLQSGTIRLGINNLTLGSTAIVTGKPSASAMVIATGTGELRKSFSGIGSFTFPVGDDSGISEYSPVTLNFTGGTFAAENYVGVKLTNSAYSGYADNYLNRYWSLTQSGIAASQYDAVFHYVTADINGNENNISCVQVEPTPIISYTPANTTLHLLTASGLTTFGIFTGITNLQHFTPDWTENGVDHMNINIYSAKIDGVELESGDEIGIFDGNSCVGVGTVKETLALEKTLDIIVSGNDGTGNGYTPGNAISYKLYDKSQDRELNNVTAVYSNTDLSWSTNGKFDIGATAFVKLIGSANINQEIALSAGWNIISANVTPANLNLKDLFQNLIDEAKLKKVMDEAGKTIENFGAFGGWKNNIGNLNTSKGYKVNVIASTTLSLLGTPVQLPLDIALNAGWNIISYPSANLQDAKTLFQSLIDAGKLRKVMDESGKTIENFGAFGGWKNNIGNFLPGKGYRVNVTTSCILTIPANATKALAVVPEVLASTHFAKAFVGNGTDHESINLVNLQTSGLQAGDEIGVFDGNLCVGSATISTEQLMAGNISIPASANDELNDDTNGFTSSHPITLKLFRNNEDYILKTKTLLNSQDVFEKGESMFAQVDVEQTTGFDELAQQTSVKCYPNPFSDQLTIEIQLPESQVLEVRIYDVNGKLVRNLYKGKAEKWKKLVWDGKNGNGATVVPGTYLVKTNEMVERIVLNRISIK